MAKPYGCQYWIQNRTMQNLAMDESGTIWMSAMDSELNHMEISKRMAEQEYKGNDPGHVTKHSKW